jgi:hypothetical protein
MKSRNFGKSNWSWSFWFLKRTALHQEEQIFSWLFEYEEDKFGTLEKNSNIGYDLINNPYVSIYESEGVIFVLN